MKKGPIHKFAHQAMGTFFEVLVAGQDEEYSRSAARAFFQEIDRLEGFFSRFDQRSEISRINRLKPGELLPVGLETYECLKLSFSLMRETDGAFNINFRSLKAEDELDLNTKNNRKNREISVTTAGPLGEKKTKKSISPGPENLKKSGDGINQFGRLDKEFWKRLFPIELLETNSGFAAVRLEVPGAGLDLDLGAIGKGYALEKAAAVFSDWGISDFLVNAGQSTVYARGEEPWPAAVGGGFDFFKAGKIRLQNRALSGSGHEVKGEHIFDPRQKKSMSRHLAAWVSHPSAAMADGLSTAFMVMNLEEIGSYCESHPEVWTLVLSRDKKSYLFKAMDIYEEGL